MGFLSTKNAVGLDIDTAEIRAVELSGSVQSPKLVKFGRIPLPGGAVIEGMIAKGWLRTPFTGCGPTLVLALVR